MDTGIKYTKQEIKEKIKNVIDKKVKKRVCIYKYERENDHSGSFEYVHLEYLNGEMKELADHKSIEDKNKYKFDYNNLGDISEFSYSKPCQFCGGKKSLINFEITEDYFDCYEYQFACLSCKYLVSHEYKYERYD